MPSPHPPASGLDLLSFHAARALEMVLEHERRKGNPDAQSRWIISQIENALRESASGPDRIYPTPESRTPQPPTQELVVANFGEPRTQSIGAAKMPDPTPASEPASNPPARNPVVQRCLDAHSRSLQQSRAKKHDQFDTITFAKQAYFEAMPDLSGRENICDFIACVAHGMLADVINSRDGPKFLYAAQVALGALQREPKAPNR